MSFAALAAAFGGGAAGALLGALPIFIMTGLFALAGALISAAGGADMAVSFVAFGPFLGPHTAFAGGVAAAAYAARQGKLEAGNDILSSLNGLAAPDVIIVGGLWGALGYVVWWLLSLVPAASFTDTVAFSVFITGCAARLAFGRTGLTGKYTGTEPRKWFSTGNAFVHNVVLGATIGLAVSYTAMMLKTANLEAALASFPIACFGFSAISLIFVQAGFAAPASHHITLPSALGAVTGMSIWGTSGAFFGVVIAVLASLLWDFAANTFNSYNDSHIDPPATSIFIMTIVVNVIGAIFG